MRSRRWISAVNKEMSPGWHRHRHRAEPTFADEAVRPRLAGRGAIRSTQTAGSALTPVDLARLVFCTHLQPSEDPSLATVRSTVAHRLSQQGDPILRSVEEVAVQYGENPDAARRRMRWSRALVDAAYAAKTA